MSDAIKGTLGSSEWLRSNEAGLKALLPPTWTHVENIDALKIGFGLKVLGVDWRSQDEFAKVMVFLERIGILQRQNGYQVRANHLSVFKT